MSIDSCNFCEEPFNEEKSYKLLEIIKRDTEIFNSQSDEDFINKGYKIIEEKSESNTFIKEYRKEYSVCYKCFVSKYKFSSNFKCPVCIDYKQDSRCYFQKTDFKLAFHQGNCKTCGVYKCSFKFENNKNLIFCGNCTKCCQKMKIFCYMCKGKYNKRYCEEHNYKSEYICGEEHCRKCCKKAHVCMICNSNNDERFKFDAKGTFHPGCFKKKEQSCNVLNVMKNI